MNTHGRDDGIGGTIAREGNTADGVVSVLVCQSTDGEHVLVRYNIGNTHSLDFAMVAVRCAA